MKRTIQVRISKGERQFVAECLDLHCHSSASNITGRSHFTLKKAGPELERRR